MTEQPPIWYTGCAQQGAFTKGWRCAQAGGSIDSNPYGDARTLRGSVTFARGFWKAWRNGFKRYQEDHA